MNKKFVRISVLVVVLAAMLVVAGTALASIPTSDEICGRGFVIGSNGLKVSKNVNCGKEMSWSWVIEKIADQTSLILSTGQTQVVNYEVTASATAADTFAVSGKIFMTSPPSAAITIESVSDSLGSVTCQYPLPHVLPAGFTLECTYTGSQGDQPSENVATVVGSGESIVAVAPIDWSKAHVTETDECVNVIDSLVGSLGNVCAGQTTTFTFNYSYGVGPYDVCGDYTIDNTASFTTDDSGATGSDSWTVDVNVPCAGGCSLTPGYWKTHSIYGPAPYDDTWALIGEDTPFFFSGVSYYRALWTPPQGNAYWILAHAYIAAELNQLNGADFTAAQAAFDQATALFSNPANTPAYVSGLRGSARQTWINLATVLDNYNNGLIGPGHCTE